ncbi:hypothetical protein Poli38472_005191 [Pythium oligandrum]|uniref:Uncharacterized protein n=1 Tax=Pythium oligandrum TaxID=41045 RepID=A0A8K1CHH6_PYTOL|nr:hypothetical protein Poli38472_005191 [Pythium oligandrum]|eukprot:TMW62573.1 hypothetical protein Poli38472_005191 [Pythium oligandrum]
MEELLTHLDDDFVIHSTQLPRLSPFPTWNGVVASTTDGRVSLICESGDVVIFALRRSSASSPLSLSNASDQVHAQVLSIINSPRKNVMSMCQCWTKDGSHLVVARDHLVIIYRIQDAQVSVRATLELRVAAASVDVVSDEHGSLNMIIGTVTGVAIYAVRALYTEHVHMHTQVTPVLVRILHPEVPVSVVKASPDHQFVAIGSVDGRVMLLRTQDVLAGVSNAPVYAKVLASPRVTSITFSPTSSSMVISTRKGNVYIVSRSTDGGEWLLDPRYAPLTENPKLKAGSISTQTLTCWWNSTLDTSRASPVFIIAARSCATELEMYDTTSSKKMHSLEFKRDPQSSSPLAKAADDTHIVGITCITNDRSVAQLLCIDSDAHVTLISWPFLEQYC